jgi:hypothetical protein
LQYGISIVEGFHALAEPEMGMWDVRDMSDDGGRIIGESSRFNTSTQVLGDGDLEESRRCSEHDYSGDNLIKSLGKFNNTYLLVQ